MPPRGDGVARWSVAAVGSLAISRTPPRLACLRPDRARVQPPAGRAYLDRSNFRPGMAVRGGLLVRAFASVGWKWGGRWTTKKDYQHFSINGK